MNSSLAPVLKTRLTAAETPWDRLWLNAHAQARRLHAHWVARGTEILKRAFDIGVSAALLVLLSPVFLLIGVAVWVEDGGAVFFAQTRVGRFGRHFKMFKVRSMCLNA